MPSFVVKAAPDEDLYAIYSTIVDAFVFIGTRGETRQRLLYEDGINGRPDERMERADLNGTSSRIGGPDFEYGWNDPTIAVREGPGCGELPRKDLVAYLRAIEAHNLDDAAALVMPDVDEEEHRVEWEAHLADLGPISPRQGSYIVDTGATTLTCGCGWSWMGPTAEAETVAAEHEGGKP